jgi:hypothetical protein
MDVRVLETANRDAGVRYKLASVLMVLGASMVSLAREPIFQHLDSSSTSVAARSWDRFGVSNVDGEVDGRAEAQQAWGNKSGRAATEKCMSLPGMKHGERERIGCVLDTCTSVFRQ